MKAGAPSLPSCRFNHAIVRTTIDEKVYWLDAASGEFASAICLLSIKASMHSCWATSAFCSSVFQCTKSTKHLEYREHVGTLLNDGSYTGTFQVEFAGELGARLRSQFVDRTTEHRIKVLQAWLGSDYPGAVGSNFSFQTVDQLSGCASYKCDARIGRIRDKSRTLCCYRFPGPANWRCTVRWPVNSTCNLCCCHQQAYHPSIM